MIGGRILLASFAIATIAAPAVAESPASSRGRVDAHAERLSDGTELVVVRVRSARRASLRYVVRAGAAYDPPNRKGLAHLVEHVIAGTRDGEERLLDVVAAAGGSMNAFTSRDATWYTLDAPADRFPSLARKLLSAITDPQFEPAEVAAVLGVVDSEAEVSGGGGLLAAVDDALFPQPADSTLGTAGNRERAGREDMLAFYRARYVTSATTVVIAGDLSPQDARALVEAGSSLPPALPGEAYGPRRGAPQLPKEQDVQAPFHAVVVGYPLDESDWEACRWASELVTVRLTYHYQIKRPVLAWADVGCHRLRGVPFLLASGYARSLEEERSLPEIIDSTLRSAVELKMIPLERRILEQRRSRIVDWLRDSPEQAADAAAALAAAPREQGATPVGQLEAQPAAASELRAFAGRTFIRDRRLSLTFSPY